ncbi:uncharacterized protein A4U43_C03F2800 [Asparagus officinalis]|uniref:Glycosyltransferase n=1 Tax=Asparagus officinalis TaxID=4686 RepID=A0A5P1F8N1_ASPOF|nr:7-deoxyloganetin glucosyltransferase-like [Asparagus officinalis]ONK74103.1 uncharacterized protein A4U43_C03F2800 [Asparagus officinalis]
MGRPHVVMLSIPGQGHINPMLELAQILHSRGFFITFVTRAQRESILRSQGPDALRRDSRISDTRQSDGCSVARFADPESHVVRWCLMTYENCAAPFKDLLVRLNSLRGGAEGHLRRVALDVAEELSIRSFVFMTMSACGFICSLYLDEVIRRDDNNLTMDTPIDFIPGLKDIRPRDLPSFVRTADQEDFIFKLAQNAAKKSVGAKNLLLNTFDLLEDEVLNALKSKFQKVYTVGPLASHNTTTPTKPMRLSLWKEEDRGYTEWLNQQRPSSVIYVNFGSIITITTEELVEFAWGLANSNHPFLWVIRHDLVCGRSAVLPKDFLDKTKERSYILSWCSQDEVISHKSIGGFLSHCGWNSTLESINSGVPMICWPRFDDQNMNARYVCKEWGFGIEIDEDVKRGQVTSKVKELMEGEKGDEIRKNVVYWRERAKKAATQGGSSYENINELIEDINLV